MRSTVEGCTAGTLACRTAHGGTTSATHKEVYDGQHEAIVDKEVFHKVQQIISENRRRSASKLKGKHNSLLGGKIFDSEGWAMSPSHSVKGGRRYRYYISQAYLQKEKDKAGNLPQIPAPNTEELVSNEIRNLLKLQLANMEVGLEQGQAYKENWYKFVKDWSLLEPKIFILIRQILQKVVVSNKGLEFTIDQDNLKAIAEIIFRGYDLPEELGKSGNMLSYTKLCKIEQVRHGKGFRGTEPKEREFGKCTQAGLGMERLDSRGESRKYC